MNLKDMFLIFCFISVSLNYILYYLNKLVMIATTIANNTVLVVTTFVAYFTSPFDSFANIGNTASAGAEACIMYVLLSSAGIVPEIFTPKIINTTIIHGDIINLPKSAKIVSLSKCILFNPAFDNTIPIYINESGVTIFPI